MKLLVIRFSSIGDVTQALSIPSFVKSYHPEAEIHFVTRADMAGLAAHHPQIAKLWLLDRKDGFKGLLELTKKLNAEGFTHIYDAHNNLRSNMIRWLVKADKKLVRPMMRLKRFLLINFHINKFEKPFSGQRDLIKPLEAWGMKFKLPATPQLFLDKQLQKKTLVPFQNYVVVVPSASYELKRWPIENWNRLIKENPETTFVVLAGPTDSFTEVLNENKNAFNLTGKTDLLNSAAIIEKSSLVISNDTGLLHFAEQLGRPAIALMGPAPFGFPSREKTLILERNLACRPCSKHGQGPCRNPNFQECLRSITVEEVTGHMRRILETA